MKWTFLFFLFLLSFAANCNAQNASLFVPSFPTTVLPVEEDIFLPAFLIDLTDKWPKDLQNYNHLVCEDKNNFLTLSTKGKILKISLKAALEKKYAVLYSISQAAYGRNRGLIIEPSAGIKLLSMQCHGIIAGDSGITDSFGIMKDLTKIVDDGYDLNYMHLPNYLHNQQKIWELYYQQQLKKLGAPDNLQQALYENNIKGSNRIPPYYYLTYNKGVLTIIAQMEKFNFTEATKNFYNDDGVPYLMLQEIINEMNPLIADIPTNDTQVQFFFSKTKQVLDSIQVAGKYRGIVPFKINYQTTQPVKLIANLLENQVVLPQGSAYKVKLTIAYTTANNNTTCQISFPPEINSNNENKTAILQGCGFTLEFKPGEIYTEL